MINSANKLFINLLGTFFHLLLDYVNVQTDANNMHPSVKWAILVIFGLVLLALGLGVGYGVVPVVVDQLVAENLDLWEPDSEGQKNFVQPPVDLYMKFYVYHVNNPEEVIQGGKPNVTEKGPYSYLEKRLKVDIRPGEGLDLLERIEFGQKKTYQFQPDLSTAGEDTKLILPNLPMLVRFSHFSKMKSTWMIQISRYIKEYKFGSLMYPTLLTEQKQ